MPETTVAAPPAMSQRLLPLGIFIGYVALTLLIYGQTLQGGFLVDDWWWTATAKHGDFPLSGANRIFFRPLASGLFVGFWHLFGANPLGYRIASLIFLILTAWMIRAIWLIVTNNKQTWVGVTAGALFILWPSHGEAVAWISAFSDLLIVLFGAVSLWSYLRYLRNPKPILAIGTIVFLVAALLTKEPAVTLPLIVFFLGQALTPQLKNRKRQLWLGLASAIGFTLAYLLVRRAYLGGQVGGYNGYKLYDVLAALRGWKLTVNLTNLYFPLGKFVAINLSPYAAHITLLFLLMGTAAALMRSVPRTAAVTPDQKRLLAGILIAGAIWSILLINGFVLDVVIFLASYRPFLFASPILLVLVIYLSANMGRRWWRDIDPFLTERKLSVYWILASIFLVLIELNRPVLSNIDLLIEISVFALFLYAIYLSRPICLTASAREEDALLRRITYAMFLVSIFALLPSIALPINIDGQQGRFSYLGTFFSVISLSAAYAVLLKSFDVRRWTTASIAGLLFLAAYSNAGEWAQAGAVSRQVTQTIRSLLPARRIYVVTAPDTISAALLFRGGIEEIPFVAASDDKCKVAVDIKIINMINGDHVNCELFSPVAAAIHLVRSDERRLESLRLNLENTDEMFENPEDFVARFLGYQNTDHAIYIDAEGAHVLE